MQCTNFRQGIFALQHNLMKTQANLLKAPGADYLRAGNHASAMMRGGKEALSSRRGKSAKIYLRLV
jgi:hypothetical protein